MSLFSFLAAGVSVVHEVAPIDQQWSSQELERESPINRYGKAIKQYKFPPRAPTKPYYRSRTANYLLSEHEKNMRLKQSLAECIAKYGDPAKLKPAISPVSIDVVTSLSPSTLFITEVSTPTAQSTSVVQQAPDAPKRVTVEKVDEAAKQSSEAKKALSPLFQNMKEPSDVSLDHVLIEIPPLNFEPSSPVSDCSSSSSSLPCPISTGFISPCESPSSISSPSSYSSGSSSTKRSKTKRSLQLGSLTKEDIAAKQTSKTIHEQPKILQELEDDNQFDQSVEDHYTIPPLADPLTGLHTVVACPTSELATTAFDLVPVRLPSSSVTGIISSETPVIARAFVEISMIPPVRATVAKSNSSLPTASSNASSRARSLTKALVKPSSASNNNTTVRTNKPVIVSKSHSSTPALVKRPGRGAAMLAALNKQQQKTKSQ